METNIIDSVIHTTRSRELVRQIIPILVGWAKHGKTDKIYGDFGKQESGSCPIRYRNVWQGIPSRRGVHRENWQPVCEPTNLATLLQN